MMTSLVLSMTLAAPVPAPAPPIPAGPAPRILELKAGADGKIMVVVTRTEKIQIQGGAINPNGAAVAAPVVARAKQVELGDVKDLVVTTADGKKLETADAIKKLAPGGTVVVSADGKPVSPTFLKMFKDDVLVLASPELMGAALPGKPLPGGVRPPIQIQPIAPGIQIQPGVIQIQVAPALPAALPAAPAPVPAPGK
ncbi:hypothetical protein J8F10_09840 [Gemmata sp. G18]|uniref:DUF5666 domain-containing protein n=1 Tax=Gemmata palustris TaxID=2822762 RepID=A0ABS5BPC4_9BACT|nr:hypothetical protein [Gemmata palustris]MBP3955582.1 hypothetical protein [Gemmata palustris]